MYALMDGGVTHPSSSALATFNAPSGLSIAGFKMWRHEEDGPFVSYGAPASNLAYSGVISVQGICARSLGCASRGTTSPWYAGVNEVSVGGLSGVSFLQWTVSCAGGSTCPVSETAYSSAYEVFSLDVILDDPTPPSVSNMSGAILAGGTVGGQQDISFRATDEGSGVYSAWIVVDGNIAVGPSIINTNGGACTNLGATKDGLRSFLHPQPCPPSVSGLLTLDTAKLKDESHTASLYVDDAAGNSTVAAVWTFTSHNAPTIQTAPYVSGSPKVGSTLTATNGTFAAPPGAGPLSAISGQWMLCNAAGEKCSPISGATGMTYTPVESDASHAIIYRNTISDADGATSAESQPTSTVSEAPSSTGSCAGPCLGAGSTNGGTGGNGGNGGNGSDGAGGVGGSSGSLTLNLSPPGPSPNSGLLGSTTPWKVSLRVFPRRVRRHTLMRLAGQVSTSPRPSGGKLIYLQARSVYLHWRHGHRTTVFGGWITFKIVRSKANGKFQASYRFRLGGNKTYQFQAVAPAEGQYRNPSGSSSITTVTET